MKVYWKTWARQGYDDLLPTAKAPSFVVLVVPASIVVAKGTDDEVDKRPRYTPPPGRMFL